MILDKIISYINIKRHGLIFKRNKMELDLYSLMSQGKKPKNLK
ncbi:hypothetical protein Ctaglu_42050 [Clostridium tagluense]|uniref:Uncharacterized protein n=1 Tax=Clostridium tagluense TaxID=360422 RepID=A0A401USP6_9CLOT|nr:hypothetical protein Ctaglu_42050 [Clostridium tagluense]